MQRTGRYDRIAGRGKAEPVIGVPKTLDSLTAILGDMPRFALTSSESVLRVSVNCKRDEVTEEA
jgi:hypothetical protein